MSACANQEQLSARLRLIEDRHERLAAIVDRVRKLPPFAEGQRQEANRVQGCVSRVWLRSTFEAGLCHFCVDADSTLVRGLASLVCEIYDGVSPSEIVAHQGDILSDLQLAEHLSPTRQNGLQQVRNTIQRFAASHIHADNSPDVA